MACSLSKARCRRIARRRWLWPGATRWGPSSRWRIRRRPCGSSTRSFRRRKRPAGARRRGSARTSRPCWRGPSIGLEAGGVKRWGESSIKDFDAYEDFLLKWGVIKQKVPATDLVTNDLLDAINQFDADKIANEARAYR